MPIKVEFVNKGKPIEDMRIYDAIWTPQVNILVILCFCCWKRFHHRSDRWNITCDWCGKKAHLSDLRSRYLWGNTNA